MPVCSHCNSKKIKYRVFSSYEWQNNAMIYESPFTVKCLIIMNLAFHNTFKNFLALELINKQ